jgi:hypothetical protein
VVQVERQVVIGSEHPIRESAQTGSKDAVRKIEAAHRDAQFLF